jgi:hypothetical protein
MVVSTSPLAVLAWGIAAITIVPQVLRPAAPPATAAPGCAAFVAALPTVAEVISDAVSFIGAIKDAVSARFAAAPNPTLQATISASIAKVEDGLVAAQRVLVGVQNASQNQLVAAFAQFTAAYGELMQALGPLGILPAQPTAADAGAVGLTLLHDGGIAPVFVTPPLAWRITVGAAR